MRKLLNTLYITTPESYLSKDGLNVVVSVKQEEIFRIPILNIEGIVTFGYMGASPGLMKLCADNGVSLTFLSPSRKNLSVECRTDKREMYCSEKSNTFCHDVRYIRCS